LHCVKIHDGNITLFTKKCLILVIIIIILVVVLSVILMPHGLLFTASKTSNGNGVLLPVFVKVVCYVRHQWMIQSQNVR